MSFARSAAGFAGRSAWVAVVGVATAVLLVGAETAVAPHLVAGAILVGCLALAAESVGAALLGGAPGRPLARLVVSMTARAACAVAGLSVAVAIGGVDPKALAILATTIYLAVLAGGVTDAVARSAAAQPAAGR